MRVNIELILNEIIELYYWQHPMNSKNLFGINSELIQKLYTFDILFEDGESILRIEFNLIKN